MIEEEAIFCQDCKYDELEPDEYPCINCKANHFTPNDYMNNFEPKEIKTKQSEFLKKRIMDMHIENNISDQRSNEMLKEFLGEEEEKRILILEMNGKKIKLQIKNSCILRFEILIKEKNVTNSFLLRKFETVLRETEKQKIYNDYPFSTKWINIVRVKYDVEKKDWVKDSNYPKPYYSKKI